MRTQKTSDGLFSKQKIRLHNAIYHEGTMLTKQEVEDALPITLKGAATQALTDTINNMSSDPYIAEEITSNFIHFNKVLREGQFKTEDYMRAVAYCTYKIMGHTNEEAYAKTHPNRYAEIIANGSKHLAQLVSAYAKGKLVNLILEQAHIPMWLVNQGNYQKAINVQVELMQTAQSEKVRSDAANSILTHLAKPKEVANNALVLQVQEDEGTKEMKKLIVALAGKQLEAMDGGMTIHQITSQKIYTEEDEAT